MVKQRKRRRPKNRLTKPLIAIGIPVIVLLIVVYSVYTPHGPAIYNLPDKIPFKQQNWMTYVPGDATFVKFVNYSSILASPSSATAVQNHTLLYDYDTKFELSVEQAFYVFTVFLGTSGEVDGFALKSGAYAAFQQNASVTMHATNYNGNTYYSYRENKSTILREHVTFKDGYVLQSVGGISTIQLIERLLSNHDKNLTTFFAPAERKAEFYLASTTESKMMGFSILPNATAAGAHEVVAAVYDATNTVDLANFYAYGSQQDAIKIYPTAQNQILIHNFATSYIIGNFVGQLRTFPLNQAKTPLNSL